MPSQPPQRKNAIRYDALGQPTGDIVPMDELFQAAIGETQQTLQVSKLAVGITLALTVTAAAYTAGDSIGGKLTLAGAVAAPGGSSLLQSVMLLDRANQKPQGTLLIFDSNPTAATLTDKTAFVFSTDDLKVTAAVPVVTADWVTINGKAVATLANIGRLVKAAAGQTTLYAAFVTTSTPTFAATTDVQMRFHFAPLNA